LRAARSLQAFPKRVPLARCHIHGPHTGTCSAIARRSEDTDVSLRHRICDTRYATCDVSSLTRHHPEPNLKECIIALESDYASFAFSLLFDDRAVSRRELRLRCVSRSESLDNGTWSISVDRLPSTSVYFVSSVVSSSGF